MRSIGASSSAAIIDGAELRRRFGKTHRHDAATDLACKAAFQENWPDALAEVARTALSLAQDPKRRSLAGSVTALAFEHCLERELCPPRELSQAAVLLLKHDLRGMRPRAAEREAALAYKLADPGASQREIARLTGVGESTLRWWLKNDADFRADYEGRSHAQ